MAQLSDTSPEAERILIEVYRRMTPSQKWLRIGQMFRDARLLHAAGFRQRHPAATRREIHQAWMQARLGFSDMDRIHEPVSEDAMQSLNDLREVLRIFNKLGIAYALGGSIASSLYGIDRYTRDADVTAEPFPGREAELAGSLGDDYYVSVPAIQDANRRRSSFNIINTSTGFKIDVFICKELDFERSAMQRRVPIVLADLPEEPIVLHTAEDIILFKLRWYRLGNESSEQQVTDVLGVLRTQGDRLDQTYLDHWAALLGVTDLLQRARQESGIG